MKKSLFITMLSAALGLAGVTDLRANGAPPTAKQTFTGKVKLAKPTLVDGKRISSLNFSGTIRQQGTEGIDIDPSDPGILDFTGTLAKNQRVTVKTILTKVLPPGTKLKGWTLRWNAYALGASQVEAYNRQLDQTVVVAASDLSLDVSWPADFDGIFNGVASYTVSDTASGTVAFVNAGRFNGFNTFLGNLKLGSEEAIIFTGVGAFRDDTKGFTGNANVAGDNYTPVPVL